MQREIIERLWDSLLLV